MIVRLRGLIGAPRAIWRVRSGSIMGAVVLALALTGLQAAPGRAAAAGYVGVSATVADSCHFAEVPEAVLTAASGSWAVTFQCTRTTPYKLELGAGRHFDAGHASRRMRGGSADDDVAYSVAVTPVDGEGRGAQFNSVTLAAKVAPSDFAEAPAGVYTDAIAFTLRHAVSGRALAFTELRLTLRADSPWRHGGYTAHGRTKGSAPDGR